MNTHPYIKFAQALIMFQHSLDSINHITPEHIIEEIEKGLAGFRMEPKSTFQDKKNVEYKEVKKEKGNPALGVFLSPSIITTDKQAKDIWKAAHEIITLLREGRNNSIINVTMSYMPISGEFLNFSQNGSIGRGKPKLSQLEAGLAVVTTLTNLKPCLQYVINKKKSPEMSNTCIIPDIEVEKLIDFISIYKRMKLTKSDSNLMVGDVLEKGGKYEPKRPLIYRGNFPNPPRSSALGSVALLGAIGEFAKESEVSQLALKVLESLKNATFYMIKYGGASAFTFSHHIIDLAKNGKLKTIVDSIYFSQLYNDGKRTSQSTDYQKFDLFTSRFLQFFNNPSFKDFIAFRAEYPADIQLLFNTYFTKMENIDPQIVSSARELGRWLNKVAYFAAKENQINENPNWEELRKAKAKVLVEIESATFSAKSGDALIAHVITRAGRLSQMDAPEAATLYMEKTASGELSLEKAKNLLIAFSRLINKDEKKNLAIQNENLDEVIGTLENV